VKKEYPARTVIKSSDASRNVDLVKNATIIKVGFLGSTPASKNLVQGKELDLREVGGIFFQRRWIAGTIGVLGNNILGLRCVEEVQVCLGKFAGAVFVNVFINNSDRWLCKDADCRSNDFKLVSSKLLENQVSLIFPGQQHITQTALGEGQR